MLVERNQVNNHKDRQMVIAVIKFMELLKIVDLFNAKYHC